MPENRRLPNKFVYIPILYIGNIVIFIRNVFLIKNNNNFVILYNIKRQKLSTFCKINYKIQVPKYFIPTYRATNEE